MLSVADRGYANPDLLAETDWLANRLTDRSVRIIDARPAQQYAAGHIPGSVNLPGTALRSARHTLEIPDADEFAVLVGNLGIHEGMTVVAYDQGLVPPAAGRLAWTFLYHGHQLVKFLDGGLTKWTSEGLPLSTEATVYPVAPLFTANPVDSFYCGLEYAKDSIQRPDVVMWDVRSESEYNGTNPRDNSPERAGHMPGALHLEWAEMIDQESRTLKSAAEMRRILEAKGITPDKEIISY